MFVGLGVDDPKTDSPQSLDKSYPCPRQPFHNLIHNRMFKHSTPFEKRLLDHWYSAGQSLRALEKMGLWGLTGVYRVLLLLRTYWHRWIAPPTTAPGVCVISIGNLVAGGKLLQGSTAGQSTQSQKLLICRFHCLAPFAHSP